ncbi:P-type DNA transfer ATPase VirB11 [Roseobacter weihaiensis]|uniref:P-type DNA transfer ATPase VirB11 n=1 Tax=Roseobacter weihaiensis TaxID=2763262 RepID=UPI001D0B354A|nr:P-type DNA transfer ATPase VirB11 [Roseobacter sp. H9]
MNHHSRKPEKAPVGLSSLLAPFASFLEREDVTEICINEPGHFYVETYDGWELHEEPKLTYDYLIGLSTSVGSSTNQEISSKKPILSGTLPFGERIQIVHPPAVPKGTISITIRRPSTQRWTLEELRDKGMFDHVAHKPLTLSSDLPLTSHEERLIGLYNECAWIDFLKLAVKEKKNVLISGATGTGKTTFSNALIPLIPDHERIVTIEDTVELQIPHANTVRLIYSKGGQSATEVSARELLESSLRMRPDRIFLQELRDATAFYYLRNVNTGHSGSITTIHADTAMLAFEQLALLVKESEAGRDLTRNEIKAMLFQMVDVVIQIRRDDNKRYISEVFFDPARKHQEGAG